jgi:uncharacterized protein (DUF1800 family)
MTTVNMISRLASLFLVAATIAGCGGGGGSSDTGNTGGTPDPTVSLSQVAGGDVAVEVSGQVGQFELRRSGDGAALSVGYSLSGHSDPAKGSAAGDDYELVYSNGDPVDASTLALAANQDSRIIEVRPVADTAREVPETLTITLNGGAGYRVGGSSSTTISIIDAENTEDNRKVFLGTFGPQGSAVTTASGTASLILRGDNAAAMVNYDFFGLTSQQVDQHIHLTDGPILKDIEFTGPVFDFEWVLSLENGAPFTTEQELLDALFEGRVFVNIHTANYPSGEIAATFAYDSAMPPPPVVALTAQEVDLDIVRFLNQATFGATPGDYQALRSRIDPDGSNRMQVYSEWIEEQFALPQTEYLPFLDAQLAIFLDASGDDEPGRNIRRDAFWTVATFARDQLRQRVAFALSQILVVSETNTSVRNGHRGTADYYDMLGLHADRTYRDLLEGVSRHSIMGAFLSHLRNEKEDPAAGYYPDENYAREIMQLFSFGLVARNRDGSIRLGADNLPIQTYDNAVIKEMAQVFTGMSFSKTVSGGNMVDNNNFSLGNNFNNGYQYRWTEPMKFFGSRHDYSEKLLFTDNGVQLVVPADTPPGQELDIVIDAVVAHSGTAPYVAERLIQRFVTSNPSRQYIERVAGAFGQTGDMKAVIRAILLDEEARNPTVMASSYFGKYKEPVLQFTAMLRLHEAFSSVYVGTGGQPGTDYSLDYANANTFENGAMLLRPGTMDIGQESLLAPSVFNFYSPDFAPTGALSNNGLVAPELELVTETQVYESFNEYHQLIRNGVRRSNRYTRDNGTIDVEQLRVRLSNTRVREVWDDTAGDNAAKAAAVAEYLDFYLNAGKLTYLGGSASLTELANALAGTDPGSSEWFELAAYGSALLPEFMVQK